MWAGLKVTIGANEAGEAVVYDGTHSYANWAQLLPESEDIVVPVKISLPVEAEDKYQDKSCKISYRVEAVQAGAKSIIESMNQTRSAVATGNENVEILVNRVKDSVEAGKHVTNELESLDEYMQKMNSIVDIITEITTQTSLLALNASIEAARAGEAGKGFAVVASEISKMADETQNAAVKITNLIGNVSSAIGKVVEVSADMINMIEGQNEATAQTAKSFQIIEGNTDAIYTHSNQLAEIVNHLSEANKEIVDSVSTVSAITE